MSAVTDVVGLLGSALCLLMPLVAYVVLAFIDYRQVRRAIQTLVFQS